MNGENMGQVELYRQLCLAADEYSSFRCNMMSSPVLTAQQIELAINKADKVVALLRMLQAQQRLAAAAVQPPAPPPPMMQPPPQKLYPDGTVLAIGKAGLPPGTPPCSAWECSGCREILWVIGATKPVRCPCCGAEFRFPEGR